MLDLYLYMHINIYQHINVQGVVCCTVKPCSDVAGYQRFGGPHQLRLHNEDEGSSMAGIVQYHTASQPRRPQIAVTQNRLLCQ
jgi:hypothetical protein